MNLFPPRLAPPPQVAVFVDELLDDLIAAQAEHQETVERARRLIDVVGLAVLSPLKFEAIAAEPALRTERQPRHAAMPDASRHQVTPARERNRRERVARMDVAPIPIIGTAAHRVQHLIPQIRDGHLHAGARRFDVDAGVMGEQDDAAAGLTGGLRERRHPLELKVGIDYAGEIEVAREVGGVERDYRPVIVLQREIAEPLLRLEPWIVQRDLK